MSTSIERQEEIDEQAADWLAALDAGRADRAAFERWRASDPAHALAFIRLDRVWRDLDRVALPQGAPVDPSIEASATARPALPRRAALKAAAGMAGMLAAGGSLFIAGRGQAHSVETAIGERRRFFVADHACLDLNTASRLRWWSTGEGIEVELQRGEVSLDLSPGAPLCTLHAAQAAFRVEAGRFNIRLQEGNAVSLVSFAGKAQLLPPHGGAAPIAIEPRQQLVVAGTMEQTRTVSDSDLRALSAWQEGELLFDGEPLSIAVREFNRYLPTPMELASADIGRVRLGGRFLTNDPGEFLRALRVNFGIRAERRADSILLVR